MSLSALIRKQGIGFGMSLALSWIVTYRVGTAAWSIPKEFSKAFSSDGQHLERYARCLKVTEIKSSFYREHKPATYAKWAGMVPEDFRFSVKLSKAFTHERRLEDTEGLDQVLEGISELGPKLGALLIQITVSLSTVKWKRDPLGSQRLRDLLITDFMGRR